MTESANMAKHIVAVTVHAARHSKTTALKDVDNTTANVSVRDAMAKRKKLMHRYNQLWDARGRSVLKNEQRSGVIRVYVDPMVKLEGDSEHTGSVKPEVKGFDPFSVGGRKQILACFRLLWKRGDWKLVWKEDGQWWTLEKVDGHGEPLKVRVNGEKEFGVCQVKWSSSPKEHNTNLNIQVIGGISNGRKVEFTDSYRHQ